METVIIFKEAAKVLLLVGALGWCVIVAIGWSGCSRTCCGW